MPLPLIPVGIALAGMLGLGGKKAYDGVQAMQEAQKIGENAEDRHKEWVARLDRRRQRLQDQLNTLETQKQRVLATTLRGLFDFLERIDQQARLQAFESMGALGVSREQVDRFAVQYVEAGGVLSGAIKATLTGAGASAVTTSLVTGFATAGTGAALSGLSGAAANSAFYAWLGGGSLAAGGFGMAGGAVVLGGIAVAPAAAVAGFAIAREGEKAKTKAIEYAANVDRQVGQLEAAIELLECVQRRAEELSEVIAQLDERAIQAIAALWKLADVFNPSNDQHIRTFATAMQLAKAESELLRVALLTDKGEINTQVQSLLSLSRRMMTESVS